MFRLANNYYNINISFSARSKPAAFHSKEDWKKHARV